MLWYVCDVWCVWDVLCALLLLIKLLACQAISEDILARRVHVTPVCVICRSQRWNVALTFHAERNLGLTERLGVPACH
jgi:hypothetical protein